MPDFLKNEKYSQVLAFQKNEKKSGFKHQKTNPLEIINVKNESKKSSSETTKIGMQVDNFSSELTKAAKTKYNSKKLQGFRDRQREYIED